MWILADLTDKMIAVAGSMEKLCTSARDAELEVLDKTRCDQLDEDMSVFERQRAALLSRPNKALTTAGSHTPAG